MSDRLISVAPRDETGTLSAADLERLCDAAGAALDLCGVSHAAIDLAIVGDEAMHALNRRWLDHDYPTDVLSFLLEEGGGIDETDGGGWAVAPREGQIIVNPDYAAREAAGHDWPVQGAPGHELSASLRELMLYVAHGTLHVCGYDDQTDAQRAVMRSAEARALAACGVAVPPGHAGPVGHGGSGVSGGERSG
ncbi:rRNA maturation RNase YbeY [Alienimonas sp. DA493]|uniref:rRNA maturation RNase YbeY n=1 Tax=Alienimonas sp. DA493 TaxID=3373605 RepID=UPI0037549B1F